MPPVSTRISRLAGPSCKSILYCSPEQPPPTTATRKTPWARPCLVRRELTFFAALDVTLIRRSSPTRKLGEVVGWLAGAAIIVLVLRNYLLCHATSTSPHISFLTVFTPATMFFNFCFAAQRAVWLSPQSGAK